MSQQRNFSIFAFLQEEGLTDIEPGKQHVHCTKRIRQLRRTLDLIALPTAYRKFGKEVYKDTSDERYLKLLILEGQRDLARHRELKASIDTKRISAISKGNVVRRKKRLSSLRLLKASKQYNQLASILSKNEEFSPQSYLEMKGYSLALSGLNKLESRHWEQAISTFSAVRRIYQPLQRQAKTFTSDFLKHELSSLIDPALRWCAHEMQIDTGIDLQDLSKVYFPSELQDIRDLLESQDPRTSVGQDTTSDLSSIKAPKSIMWRGYKASINDPEASNAIAIAESLEADLTELSKNKIIACGSYDKILAAWQDSVDAVTTLISRGEHESNDHDEGLQILFTFSSFRLISNRMVRDKLLLWERVQRDKQSKKNQQMQSDESLKESHRLCIALIQSAAQIYGLPGVARDEELCSALSILTKFWKSQSFFFMSKRRYRNDKKTALALAKAAVEELQGVQFGLETSEMFFRLQFKESDVESAKLCAISWYYAVLSTSRFMSGSQDSPWHGASPKLFQASEPNLLRIRTNTLSPIALKPVFFDVAYNHIDYPRQTAVSSAERPDGMKKGLFGIFSR